MTVFILLYLLITIGVAVWASRKVKNREDYLLAGRRLPYFLVTATLFATWFGSETILGASSEFATGGLMAVIREPFGAGMCLILLGAVFAKPLYRMNLLTFGDFYRNRYGKQAEFISGIFIILSYVSWIAAQMVAFGIITDTLLGYGLTESIIMGAVIVTGYTFIGGMWSVTVTDFLQMIFIVLGLSAVVAEVWGIVHFSEILDNLPEGFFMFYPDADPVSISNYFAAWIALGFGSLAGQDLFQRVMASKNEKVAVRSAITAGILYISISLIPLGLSLVAMHLLPEMQQADVDLQMLIPTLVSKFSSATVQIILFGALLSAILSTASSAILAPAAVLGENIIRPRLTKLTETKLLWASKISVVFISGIALFIALRKGNIYILVGESASVGLVSLFIPLTFGLFWPKANAKGCLYSMLSGLFVWLFALWIETEIEAIMYGFAASILGMLMGSMLGKKKM